MRLPPGYHDALTRFDPELRLRWSERRCCWLLERKARFARLPVDPRKYGHAEHDTIIQLRDGYFTLGSYQPKELPSAERLIAYLKTQDTRHRGDQDLARLADAIADELDAADLAREEAQREASNRDTGDRAADLWESQRWEQKLRIAVPRTLPSGA